MEFKSFSEAKRCDSPETVFFFLLLSLTLCLVLSPSLSVSLLLLFCSTQESWGARSAVNQFHLVCFHIFIQSWHAQRFQKPHDAFIGA